MRIYLTASARNRRRYFVREKSALQFVLNRSFNLPLPVPIDLSEVNANDLQISHHHLIIEMMSRHACISVRNNTVVKISCYDEMGCVQKFDVLHDPRPLGKTFFEIFVISACYKDPDDDQIQILLTLRCRRSYTWKTIEISIESCYNTYVNRGVRILARFLAQLFDETCGGKNYEDRKDDRHMGKIHTFYWCARSICSVIVPGRNDNGGWVGAGNSDLD